MFTLVPFGMHAFCFRLKGLPVWVEEAQCMVRGVGRGTLYSEVTKGILSNGHPPGQTRLITLPSRNFVGGR